MILWFYAQKHPKAQPAVVLVLKRLRRQGNGLKSHPTDWENSGIEPWFTRHRFIPFTTFYVMKKMNQRICIGDTF